ncbi:MAG TPA: hypothetical protein DCW52_01905, partial [Gammaproteobacteria bacterium]|nr:hypothetical protein [Gammaproteobacteria bacterium]
SYRLHIYRNALSNAGHWVGVELSDSVGRSTIGANVEVVTKTGKQFSRIVTGDSFSSQHSANLHFGLGAQTEIEEVRVTWADGTRSTLKQPEVDQYHKVTN